MALKALAVTASLQTINRNREGPNELAWLFIFLYNRILAVNPNYITSYFLG